MLRVRVRVSPAYIKVPDCDRGRFSNVAPMFVINSSTLPDAADSEG